MSSSSHKKHSLLRDLNIWIDEYDDLFSDFDPRPYEERAISDDFIAEMNKLAGEKDELIRTLRFQIPGHLRNAKTEDIITRRLMRDFRLEFNRFSNELRASHRRGILMAVTGIAALSFAVTLTTLSGGNFWNNVFRVVFEPSGWFLVWTGLEKIAYGGKPLRRKRDFYARLEKCKVEFVTMETPGSNSEKPLQKLA